MFRSKGFLFAFFLLATSLHATAVYQSADDLGQALIYPYFTAQSATGNPFNTFISVVNHSADAKVLRVRVREGRNARALASINLFLSGHDVWTGAVVPTATGNARLISLDRSCTSPQLSAQAGEAPGITFSPDSFQGDFLGTGVDRTREGFIEVLEMGTLLGDAAINVTHDSSGVPPNCGAVQGSAALSVGPPSGQLSGTLTLINVANGTDFDVNAVALAGLASRSFYRPAADPYPDFNSAEIDPISVVTVNGSTYTSIWSRPVDAVSAVLMRANFMGEFILDTATRSKTDVIVTYPTRQHYVANAPVSPPFGQNCDAPSEQTSGEGVRVQFFDREEKGTLYRGGILLLRCFATEAVDFTNSSPPTQGTSTSVLGAANLGMASIVVPPSTSNGWFSVDFPDARSLTSLPSSVRTNAITGATTLGAHTFTGLPMVGFAVRTFENGALVCSSGTCQGNYGGAFPLKFVRNVSPTS